MDVSSHVETVVLLGDKRVDGHIKIDVDVEKLDNTGGVELHTQKLRTM